MVFHIHDCSNVDYSLGDKVRIRIKVKSCSYNTSSHELAFTIPSRETQ